MIFEIDFLEILSAATNILSLLCFFAVYSISLFQYFHEFDVDILAKFLARLCVADIGKGGGFEGEAVGDDGGIHACGVEEGDGLLGEGEGGHEDAALVGELQRCLIVALAGEDEVLILAVLMQDEVEVALRGTIDLLSVGDVECAVAAHRHRDRIGLVETLQIEVALRGFCLYLYAPRDGLGGLGFITKDVLDDGDVGVGDVILPAHGTLAELLEADGLVTLAALEGDVALASAAGVVLMEMQLVAVLHLLAVHPVGDGDGVLEVEGGGDDDGGVLVGG